jgi:hypothetical protein
MKIEISAILFFVISCFHAQEIMDKDALKKCRKEFSKKICLSDEDKDEVLFYLDKCPKESGVAENNGCPWPDADKDGVTDKDDACPTVAGLSENNGCPWPDTDGDGILDRDDACPTIPGVTENQGCPKQTLDCTKFYEEEKLKFDTFRNDNKNIESVYNLLSINILDYFKKENKNTDVQEVYLNFLDYGPSCLYYPRGYVPRCTSSRSTDEYNFLITRFWNKKALENFVKKYNASILIKYYFKEYEKDYSEIFTEELHNFLVKRKINDTRVVISPTILKKSKNKISIKIEIRFINPYQLMITYTPYAGGLRDISKKLEYRQGKWIEIKE